MMGVLSAKDGVLHADGKPCPWFKQVEGGVWQYISMGPGKEFRAIITVREGDPNIHEQHQLRDTDGWRDIENPGME